MKINIALTINEIRCNINNYDEVFNKTIENHLQKKVKSAMSSEDFANMRFECTGKDYDDLVLNIYGPEDLKEKARIAISGK